MRKILTVTVLLGVVLGFAVKMFEVNVPGFGFAALNGKLLFKSGNFMFGTNDLAHVVLWGVLAIAVGPLGLAALAGFAIHQGLWYFGGMAGKRVFGFVL